MPFLEFKCQLDHVTEWFFKTISDGEAVDSIDCPLCSAKAAKIFSVPLGFGLYGNPDGYHNPSPTKRFSNKTFSQRDGNKNSHG